MFYDTGPVLTLHLTSHAHSDRQIQTEIALDTSRRYRFIEIRCSINFRAKSARRKAPEQKTAFVDTEVSTFIDNWNVKKPISAVQAPLERRKSACQHELLRRTKV